MVATHWGLSTLQKQKLTHLYYIFDVNYSGKIEMEDFTNLVVCLANARGIAPGSSGYQRLEAPLMRVWQHIERMGDADYNGAVDLDEWLRFFAHTLSDHQHYTHLIQPLEAALIDLLDTYGDGRISHRDYRDVVLAIHLDVSDVALMFRQLDLNRDGYITTDEATKAISEFFLSSEDSPGNWFFGDYAVMRR